MCWYSFKKISIAIKSEVWDFMGLSYSLNMFRKIIKLVLRSTVSSNIFLNCGYVTIWDIVRFIYFLAFSMGDWLFFFRFISFFWIFKILIWYKSHNCIKMYTERSCFHLYLSPANPIGNHSGLSFQRFFLWK